MREHTQQFPERTVVFTFYGEMGTTPDGSRRLERFVRQEEVAAGSLVQVELSSFPGAFEALKTSK